MLRMNASDVEKRNFVLNAAEGGIFISSGAFTSAQTVLPALVARLGGTNFEIGILGVISYAALFFPQILAARYTETLPWKKPWPVWIGLAHRMVVLVIGIVILVFGETRPGLSLTLLLSLLLIQQILVGLTTPGWFDLFVKLTPPNRRGRLIGLRTSLGGASAFLGGLVLTWLLVQFRFPLSYALAFFLGFALQMISLVVQWRLIEEEPSRIMPRRPVAEFLYAIPAMLRENPAYRTFLFSTALLIVAAMPVGFFTAYGLRHFDAPEAVVGEFTLTIVATQVVSALGNGYLADRFGNKIVLILAAGSLLLATVTASLAPTLGWYRLVFVFLGINLGSEIMARYNIAVEFGPQVQRSTYIGVMNTLLAPFYCMGLFGGWFIDRFGFVPLYAIAASFSILGLIVLTLKVTEPARRR